MYLKKVVLKNIKSFSHLEIDFAPDNIPRLWTTILGQNGLGKSTLLRAIGAVLAGPSAIRELLPIAEGWVRNQNSYGEIEAKFIPTDGDSQTRGQPRKKPYSVNYIATGNDLSRLPSNYADKYTASTLDMLPGEDSKQLRQTAYAEGNTGWLACGYGPFRRLSGGAEDANKIVYSGRKSARFVTLFREDAALTNAADWLISLYNIGKEGDESYRRSLAQVKEALSKDIFPQPAELQVDARSAKLKIGDQSSVPFHDLSDGYRSMLALGIDLMRWMIAAFPGVENPMIFPGVVLIDELDVHAHPAWQREMGFWLRRKFPKIQFVIATHSPFLAQVANEPGGNIVLEKTTDGVGLRDDVESVTTWRADQILTELFDLPTTRSPEVQQNIEELQSLRQKHRAHKLSAEQETRYKQLEIWGQSLPPAIENPDERLLAESLQAAVEQRSDRIREIE